MANMSNTPVLPKGYKQFLNGLKDRIERARVQAAQLVNRELVLLYWQIGQDILQRQDAEGWGAKVIDRLARDLKAAFLGMRGFSARNLKYMRAFAQAYPDRTFVQQVVAQMPWSRNLRLLDRVPDPDERRWYIAATIEHGWSRNVLTHQIESGLYHRSGKALTNFTDTLPPPQSDLARQILKDPYSFEFLGIADNIKVLFQQRVTRFLSDFARILNRPLIRLRWHGIEPRETFTNGGAVFEAMGDKYRHLFPSVTG